jgi:predicted ester cyclase
MSVEANKEIARRFIDEVWQHGDRAAAQAIIADDIVIHPGTFAGQPPGPEGQIFAFDVVRRAFPDMEWTIDLLVAEGDFVVDRCTMRGTHTGPFGAMAPNGQRARWTGIDILRIADGKVVEMWHAENRLRYGPD